MLRLERLFLSGEVSNRKKIKKVTGGVSVKRNVAHTQIKSVMNPNPMSLNSYVRRVIVNCTGQSQRTP